MYFTKAAVGALLSLAHLTLATATPVEAASAPLEKRQNYAYCTRVHVDIDLYDYKVQTIGYWADDWGNRLLQNLYNQCGMADGWGFGKSTKG
jgi:hypothetical protein